MLRRQEDENGTYYLRTAPPQGYFPSQRILAEIAEYRGMLGLEGLLREREGPFLGSYLEVERFTRDGACWVRVQNVYYEFCLDLELRPDGELGAVVAVPVDEAYAAARAADAKRGVRIVVEPAPDQALGG